jgi:hypothetical protein
MLSALSEAQAEYLVVGAHALAAHGTPRATGDLDLWVRPSEENAKRVWSALIRFGAPLEGLREADLTEPDLVIQIGVPPVRIDLLTSVSGLTFQSAWGDHIEVQIEGLTVPVIGRRALIENKRAAGRPKDLADVHELEQQDRDE